MLRQKGTKVVIMEQPIIDASDFNALLDIPSDDHKTSHSAVVAAPTSVSLRQAIGHMDLSYWRSSASYLHLLSKLYGVASIDEQTANILVIGCGDGMSVLPFACQSPDASYVAIDPSGDAINTAEQYAKQLNLTNISFRCGNLSSVLKKKEQFDYIIIKDGAQLQSCDNIFEQVSSALSDKGVVYIEFEALPAAYFKRAPASMFNIFQGSSANKAPQQAWEEMVSHLYGVINNDAFKNKQGLVNSLTNKFRYDEVLHASKGFYVGDVLNKAQHCGLSFVTDASRPSNILNGISDQIKQWLLAFSDNTAFYQQTLDFIRQPNTRYLVLAKSEQTIRSSVDQDFLVQCNAVLTKPLIEFSNEQGLVTFKARETQESIAFEETGSIALVRALANAYPARVPIQQLLQSVDECSDDGNDDHDQALRILLDLIDVQYVTLSHHADSCINEVSEKPKTTLYNQKMAISTKQALTNSYAISKLDSPSAILLHYADGNLTLEDILDKLIDHIEAGELSDLVDDELIGKGRVFMRITLRPNVEQSFENFARSGLLIG